MEEKDRMKRLLCVLMIMVMAVLLVPTIANADRPEISLYDGNTLIKTVDATTVEGLPTPPE